MRRSSFPPLVFSAVVLCFIGAAPGVMAGEQTRQPTATHAARQGSNALDAQIQSYIRQQLAHHKDLGGVQAAVEDRVVTLSGSVHNFRGALEAQHLARQVSSVDGVINRIAVNAPLVPDQKLGETIAERLTYDRMGMGQTFNYLVTQVHAGVVTVSGNVRNYPDRDSALAIVDDTKGVRGVIDQIQVAPLSQFDDEIRFQAARAIYGNPTLQRYGSDPAHPIRILVENGHVTLAGVVGSQVDKQVAATALAGINGIFSVTNDLVVAP